MCSPAPAFYPLLARLLAPWSGSPISASLTAVTDLVWALLAAQSLHPADLVRALPDLDAARARQGFRRVRRVLDARLLPQSGAHPRAAAGGPAAGRRRRGAAGAR